MLWHPVVGDVVRAGCISLGGVQVEWQECTYRRDHRVRWIGLLECRALIGKSSHPSVASEVVIERPVFLN